MRYDSVIGASQADNYRETRMKKTPTEIGIEHLQRAGYAAEAIRNGTLIQVQDPVQSSQGNYFEAFILYHTDVVKFLHARS